MISLNSSWSEFMNFIFLGVGRKINGFFFRFFCTRWYLRNKAQQSFSRKLLSTFLDGKTMIRSESHFSPVILILGCSVLIAWLMGNSLCTWAGEVMNANDAGTGSLPEIWDVALNSEGIVFIPSLAGKPLPCLFLCLLIPQTPET